MADASAESADVVEHVTDQKIEPNDGREQDGHEVACALQRGVVGARDVIYFASFIGFWLYLTTVIVDAKKAD